MPDTTDTETTTPFRPPANPKVKVKTTAPATSKVTPITKAKGSTKPAATTKPADPEPAAADGDLPEGPYMFSRGKLFGAMAAMGALLYLIYDHLGVFRTGRGFLGVMAGFFILAAIVYGVSLVLLHLLHIHHRAIGSWLVRLAGHGLAWAGRRTEHLLTSAYVRLGLLAAPLIAWAGDRWRRRGPADDDEAEDGRLLPSEEIEALNQAEPCPTCGAGVGEPCKPGCDDITKDPAGAPVPAEPAAAPAAAGPARNGDTVATTTTTPEGKRTGKRFGGSRVPPQGRAMIAMIDDFTPATDEELHEVLLALAAFEHDLGCAMQDLHERCLADDTRLGKGAMIATHDAADGVVDAAASVANASAAFANYYEGVTEEVAGGTVLPRDGDFITGTGAGD